MKSNLFLLLLAAVAAGLFFNSCDSSEISEISPEPESPRPLLAGGATPQAEDLDPKVPSLLPAIEETEALPLELSGDEESETEADESESFHGPPDPVFIPVAAQIEVEPTASETADAPKTLEDFSLFYKELAPMGEWFETDEYGFVWQPFIAQNDPKWRPYTLGRWVDSDQGWAWISEEPFGWATYHYGRWALLEKFGWVWVPGEIWAPSWVAWRRSEEYIGWAPLPPETLYGGNVEYGPGVDLDYGISPSSYTFMPVGYFDEPVHSYCEPPAFSLSYFPHTINVTHVRVGPSRVHCGGPKREFIKRCLGRDLKCYAVKCDPVWNHHAHGNKEHCRPRFDKDTVWICAPTVKAPWNAKLRPAFAVKKIEKPVIVRRADWPKAPNVKNQFANARRTRAFLANQVSKTKPAEKPQDHSAAESALRNVTQVQRPQSPPSRPQILEETSNPNFESVAERNTRLQQATLFEATRRAEAEATRQQRSAAAETEAEKRAAMQRAAADHQRAEAEASRKSEAEKTARQQTLAAAEHQRAEAEASRKSEAEKTARQQALAAAEAEKRAAMQRAAAEHQRAETEASRKAEAEKTARQQTLAAAEAEKRAAMQRAAWEHQQAEADAARKAEADRRRAQAEKAAREQQLAAAEAEKRATMQRASEEHRRAEAEASRKADAERQHAQAEKAAREKQQRAQVAAVEAARREEANRRRAAAERAAKEHQRTEAEASRKADAERQRAAAQQAAREQQRAATEAEKRTAMQRAAQEHQRAEAEASRKAEADRQRAAAEQAAREKQRAAAEAEKRSAMQRAAQEHQRAEAEAARKSQADRQRAEAQQAARDQQQRAAAAAAESAKREVAARQREAAQRAARDRERAQAQRQREAQQRARAQAQRSNNNGNRGSGKKKR